MKKTLMKIGSVLVMTGLMAALAMAQEKPATAADASGAKIKKIEAMGSARARAQQAVQEITVLFDANVSGYNAKVGEVQKSWETVRRTLDEAIRKEQAKPQQEQNAEYLQLIINEGQKAQELWNKYERIEKPAIDGKLGEIYNLHYYTMNPACGSLCGIDGYWTKLNLDPDMLKTAYELFEKRAKEMKAQQEAALADLDKQVAAWQDALKNAQSRSHALVGAGVGR